MHTAGDEGRRLGGVPGLGLEREEGVPIQGSTRVWCLGLGICCLRSTSR